MKIDISNYDFLPLNFIIAPVKDIHAFIFTSTSLSTYYVLGSIPSLENTAVQTDKNSCTQETYVPVLKSKK